MKRAIFIDMAERLRCRAIGVRARAAKERRNALMVEAFSFIIARAPLTDRAGAPHAVPVPEPWHPACRCLCRRNCRRQAYRPFFDPGFLPSHRHPPPT